MTPSSPPDLAQRIASLPSPPERAFASDNAAGAHPAVIDAIVAANTGHALAYGADPWTAEFEDRCADLFGRPVGAYLVWNGTGANVMALASALGPADCVVCTEWSHIAVDEAGAPERILGAKLLPLPSADAKLVPEQLEALAHLQGVEHHAQPAVVSLTQCTELGTVYSADEIAALCATAHRMGMVVHLDGARLANACAALGGTRQALRSFTVDAGVDLISFGGTKNGLLGGEAVIVLNPALGRRAKFIRKMVNQLPSKMRFVAAQFNALLEGDVWLANAAHANAMATALYDGVAGLDGVRVGAPPAANSVFPCLPDWAIAPLREWCFFWDWDHTIHQVRWMTAWDTTSDDVSAFLAGVRHLVC